MEDAAKRLHIAGFSPREILILIAEKDELVGRAQGEKIDALFQGYFIGEGKTEVRKVVVKGALHVECLWKDQRRREATDDSSSWRGAWA